MKTVCRTVSGHIRGEECEAIRLELKTVSGNASWINVKTCDQSSAAIAADDAGVPEAAVSFRTVSGDVMLSGVRGSLGGSTVSGNVLTDLPTLTGDISIKTVSGNVRFKLGADSACQYELKTASGKMRAPEKSIKRQNRRSCVGLFGSPGYTLRAATVSGDIGLASIEQ